MPTIDPEKKEPVGDYPVESPLLSCAFDPGGRFLLAGGRDRGLVAVDLVAGRSFVIQGHDSWIGAMARAMDALVLTADYTGTVIAWGCNRSEPEPEWKIEAHPSTIYSLSVSRDGHTFATADRDGLVRLWRTGDGSLLSELPRFEFPAYGVALHPDGEQIIIADRQPQKPRIKLWDIARGVERLSLDVTTLSGYRRVEDIEWGGIRGLEISPDGRQMVACGRSGYDGPGCALLFDTATGTLQHQLSTSLKGGFIYMAKFHPNGTLATSGGDIGKGELHFWSPGRGESLAVIETPGPCTALDLHPDGIHTAVTMNIGKGSYPDSGKVTLFKGNF